MNNSELIIDTLKQSAIALENQDQSKAINTLEKISNEVVTFQKEAKTLEQKASNDQKENVTQLSTIIKLQGEAHADNERTKKELDLVYSKVTAQKASIGNLNRTINLHNQELKGYEKKLRQNQARIDDLNDDSVGSIFVSIATLGMDRAVKAISIEIDGVKDKIKNSKNTINTLNKELNSLNQVLAQGKKEIQRLSKISAEKSKKIKDLQYNEFKLHNQERAIRKKVVFFTEVNLFYIKIQNLLKNISSGINDVFDIVSVLDDQTPTIASFDPSRHDLLTLKEAILLFGENVDKNISMETSISVFDENRWYSFTTEWLGKAKSLDIVNDGTNNKLIMAKTGNYSGQYWKIKSLGNSFFRLTTSWLKEGKSLDIINDGTNNQLIMADTGNYTGQFWKIEPEFGFYRLTCQWLGERKSLDIVNDGTNNKLIMADSGNYSGQHWKIIPR
jgi:uncharacterized protein (DUF2249 family)/predicted  nucleic acid-binding Zn-ribbon protein